MFLSISYILRIFMIIERVIQQSSLLVKSKLTATRILQEAKMLASRLFEGASSSYFHFLSY